MTDDPNDPLFLTVEEVLTLHEDQLRLFGGAAGIRDRNALDSRALDKPGLGVLLRQLAAPHESDE